MAVDGSQGGPESQSARDDAHLQSLGIKPELQRSLGFLSNFAVAFSYISVSTGTFTLIGLGLATGGPAFIWSWPIIIVGQLFVALNFAELASHFPVAGSIYQWSKRLSNKTLGFFTGWIYFWAGILTTTAVAITVPLVLSSIFGFALTDKSPVGFLNMIQFWAVVVLITTTLINAFGVRLLSIINNLGVGAEILGDGRVRPDPADLLPQPAAVGPHHHGRPGEPGGRQLPLDLPRRDVHVPVRRLRLRHRGHVRRGDHQRRQAGAARAPVRRSCSRA